MRCGWYWLGTTVICSVCDLLSFLRLALVNMKSLVKMRNFFWVKQSQRHLCIAAVLSFVPLLHHPQFVTSQFQWEAVVTQLFHVVVPVSLRSLSGRLILKTWACFKLLKMIFDHLMGEWNTCGCVENASIALVLTGCRRAFLASIRTGIYRFTTVSSSENGDAVHILNWCPVGMWELWILGASFVNEWLWCLKIHAYLVGVLPVLSPCTACQAEALFWSARVWLSCLHRSKWIYF